MTKIEEKILNIIQHNFPIHPDPYGEIGKQLGCSRTKVHNIINNLRSEGIIRRIGGSFNARRMGYVSLLVGANVTLENIETVASIANKYPEITHNYQRGGYKETSSDVCAFNLWFTIIARSEEKVDMIVEEIAKQPGVIGIHKLPASKVFKLKVDFDFNTA